MRWIEIWHLLMLVRQCVALLTTNLHTTLQMTGMHFSLEFRTCFSLLALIRLKSSWSDILSHMLRIVLNLFVDIYRYRKKYVTTLLYKPI
uniref:Secreted protein n=1 Tax=Heterorhabditis bacteriophora TaxID=37862 RepID=A0A1I7W6Z8_HETBA